MIFRNAALLLLGATALVAQISEREFAARRDALAARIDSGVVIAFGGRNPITDFGPFYQLPAFKYLTNFEEPDAAFVMVVRGGKGSSTLFLTPSEPRRAFYYGWRPDSAAVRRIHGMNGRSFGVLTSVVDSLAKTGLPFYTLDDFEAADFGRADSLTRGRSFMKAVASRNTGLVGKDAHDIVNQLRAKKSPAEIALLRKAAEISSEGHRAAMLAPVPKYEYEIQAAVEHAFKRLGAARPAYGSIVGSGSNGTILHYMKDRGGTKPGDVIVIDAGAEYEGYTADITRTIPVSGTFTPEQKQLYQLVRDAQAAAERNSLPGMPAAAATDSSVVVRTKGLVALGLAESDTATFDPPWQVNCARGSTSCRQAYFWMIHGISHGVGLEVHDPAQYTYV